MYVVKFTRTVGNAAITLEQRREGMTVYRRLVPVRRVAKKKAATRLLALIRG
jgi:hypothetical protein